MCDAIAGAHRTTSWSRVFTECVPLVLSGYLILEFVSGYLRRENGSTQQPAAIRKHTHTLRREAPEKTHGKL